MASENGTFSYQPSTSGTYTWSFRMKNSGMVAQPASVYYLDNLQVSYTYPYTRIDCDKGQNAFYRYGFNTQEKDDEVYGEGNLNTALFWEYDTRLGRRWNLDPVFYEWESPFAVMGGNPVSNSDVLGNDWLDDFNKKGDEMDSKARQFGESFGKFFGNVANSVSNFIVSNPSNKPVIGNINSKIVSQKVDKNHIDLNSKAPFVGQKIIQTGNVKFANKHSSGIIDNATAQSNINDVVKGDKMNTSEYAHPKGAKVKLNDNAAKAFLALAIKYKLTVSEIAGGKHGEKSLHYQGKAFDITYVNNIYMNESSSTSTEFINDAKKVGFIVNVEYGKNHIHLQWGSNNKPKN